MNSLKTCWIRSPTVVDISPYSSANTSVGSSASARNGTPYMRPYPMKLDGGQFPRYGTGCVPYLVSQNTKLQNRSKLTSYLLPMCLRSKKRLALSTRTRKDSFLHSTAADCILQQHVPWERRQLLPVSNEAKLRLRPLPRRALGQGPPV